MFDDEAEEQGPFEGTLGQFKFKGFNPVGPFASLFQPQPGGAPSPTPGLQTPKPQLKRPPMVDPRAAVWRFQAQVKKCPSCPSEIVSTLTPPALITAEQAWATAMSLKSATKAQWIIASRQRKQGEPKAGEWFSVWIPSATLSHLKNLEP